METASEVALLYQADRAERVNQPRFGTPAYLAMRARDRERRDRVRILLDQDLLQTPDDFFAGAWILNHGDEADDAWQAHLLALRAAEGGYRPARWLAPAACDRWLMYLGKPQKYGTQYVSDGIRQKLWDVAAGTTDEERAEWDVPPLAEQLRKAEEATRNHPKQPRDHRGRTPVAQGRHAAVGRSPESTERSALTARLLVRRVYDQRRPHHHL